MTASVSVKGERPGTVRLSAADVPGVGLGCGGGEAAEPSDRCVE